MLLLVHEDNSNHPKSGGEERNVKHGLGGGEESGGRGERGGVRANLHKIGSNEVLWKHSKFAARLNFG